MMLRSGIGWALLTTVVVGTAFAQESSEWEALEQPQRGSLTIVSTPPGVVVRLRDAKIELAGRTPWTVSRGLQGVFDVDASLDGFESWSRKVFLNPTASDTLHIRLTEKKRFWAGLRSLVIPGWGQRYSGRSGAGAAFFFAELAGGVGLYLTDSRYWGKQDDLDAAFDFYAATDIQSEREERWLEVERRRAIAEEAADDRDLVLTGLIAVHAANFLDAIIFFPNRSVGSYSPGHQVYAAPRGDRVDLGVRFRY